MLCALEIAGITTDGAHPMRIGSGGACRERPNSQERGAIDSPAATTLFSQQSSADVGMAKLLGCALVIISAPRQSPPPQTFPGRGRANRRLRSPPFWSCALTAIAGALRSQYVRVLATWRRCLRKPPAATCGGWRCALVFPMGGQGAAPLAKAAKPLTAMSPSRPRSPA